jgi:hypothetical protein
VEEVADNLKINDASQISNFKKSLLKQAPDILDRKKGTQNMQVILKKQFK